MYRLAAIFLLSLFTYALVGQAVSDLTRLQNAHHLLYECRTSYNLNPVYIKDCLSRADQIEATIKSGSNLLRQDPVGVFTYNAEYGYLNYINAEINKTTGADSTIHYLRLTFKYIEKAREEYAARGIEYTHPFINREDVQVLYDEVYGYVKKYGMQHIAKENEAFDWMPSFKPYRYSAKATMPEDLLNTEKYQALGDVDALLKKVLDHCGYDEHSYFYYPNGFVLVTQMEQINEDGSSKDTPSRWSNTVDAEEWSLWNYLKALFTAHPSYYRVFAFVVTDQPIKIEESVNRNQFVTNTLINKLPKELKELPLTPDHSVTVLVYEFQRLSSQEGVSLNSRSKLTGKMHLRSSKIMDYWH